MPSLKLDVRTSTVGSPDLVTFFVKGTPLPPGVPASEFDGAVCGTVLLRDKNQRTLVVGLGEKDKVDHPAHFMNNPVVTKENAATIPPEM